MENGLGNIWNQFSKETYTVSSLLARKNKGPEGTTKMITDLEYKISKEPVKGVEITTQENRQNEGSLINVLMNGSIYQDNHLISMFDEVEQERECGTQYGKLWDC